MRIAIVVALFLLAVPARSEAPETPRQKLFGYIDAAIEHGWVEAGEVDAEAIVSEALERARRLGRGSEAAHDWVTSRIMETAVGEAVYGARPDRSARYALPMQLRVPRLLTNGIGTYSHTGWQHYCFDFLTRIGDEIVAAREGKVVRVVDGHPNGVDTYDAFNSNIVTIGHADGTFASYVHLSPGITVEKGDSVKRRQPLARSGYSGGGNGEHLHFCVSRFDEDGVIKTLPILFGRPGTPGFVPEMGSFYGRTIRPTPNLRISVGDRVVRADDTVRALRGATVQLQVEFRMPDGRWRDVTTDRGTEYEPLTLWNVSAAPGGKVSMAATPGFGHMAVKEPSGVLLVMFRQGRLRGEGRVSFIIE